MNLATRENMTDTATKLLPLFLFSLFECTVPRWEELVGSRIGAEMENFPFSLRKTPLLLR